MRSNLIHNSMSVPEELMLSNVGKHVWRFSLRENAGRTGAEFINYLHSDLWHQHERDGHGRHYILPSFKTDGGEPWLRYHSILLPLMAKAIILNHQNTVYVTPITRLIRSLHNDAMPDVGIVFIEGFNGAREREDELSSDQKYMIEDYIYECINRKRRIYTCGSKSLANSLRWSEELLTRLREVTTELNVMELENASG